MALPLTTSQAATKLGISKSRVIVLINEGRLPATRVGVQFLIDAKDLDLVRERPTGRPRNRPAEKKTRKGK